MLDGLNGQGRASEEQSDGASRLAVRIEDFACAETQ
jgi:hypothetical protein